MGFHDGKRRLLRYFRDASAAMIRYRAPDSSSRSENSNGDTQGKHLIAEGLMLLLVGTYCLYRSFECLETSAGHRVGLICFATGFAICVAGALTFVGGIVFVFDHA